MDLITTDEQAIDAIIDANPGRVLDSIRELATSIPLGNTESSVSRKISKYAPNMLEIESRAPTVQVITMYTSKYTLHI